MGSPESSLWKSPEQGPKVRVLIIENVTMGSGSLAERLEQGSRAERYQFVNRDISHAPEFAAQETRPTVTIVLLNFPEQDMTIEDVQRWLAAHPEYDNYEFAAPEHLDALNSNSELARMITEEKGMWIVAPGASTIVVTMREVAYLRAWESGGRRLYLHWADERWSRRHWFALVRKDKADSET